MTERQDRYPWVEGMKVAVVSNHGYLGKTSIAKLTKASAVTTQGGRYSRDLGLEKTPYPTMHIEPWTAEHETEYRRRILASKLEVANWRALPLATLERVVAVLEGAGDE